ncbi:unnamed protein product [Ectocarpus sp. CCAP 1310/34]|nr:unnamed protein product [Ectocarpus sp. CCAP 1310/34]
MKPGLNEKYRLFVPTFCSRSHHLCTCTRVRVACNVVYFPLAMYVCVEQIR